MVQRNAIERRVYRLATLLTGNPIAATKVIEQVMGSLPKLHQLDSAHLDRLTVLRSRELQNEHGMLAHALVPHEAARALASLTPQQREAWVFNRVYQLPMRETSRAMDCSTTAVEGHLAVAEKQLALHLVGEMGLSAAAKALLGYSLTVDVPEFHRLRVRALRRRRSVWWVIYLLLAAVAVIAAWLIWKHEFA